MKNLILLLFFVATLSCGQKSNHQTPEEVLSNAIEKLNNWETLSFTASISNPYIAPEPEYTDYKLKKVSYEPHLKMYFFKNMNKQTRVYYKLASLVVVEDIKKKITEFDYVNDRAIPQYLEAFMADDDNLVKLTDIINTYKDEITYVEKVEVDGKQAYVYAFRNYKFWLAIEDALPLKYEVDNGFPQPNVIVYSDVVFNQEMGDEVFTHKEKEGYVFSQMGVKAEPLLNTAAKEFSLLDLDGNTKTLSDFKGKPIFLEAWVSSCHHCIASIPKVKKIQEEFGSTINIVTVNFDYDLPETKRIVSKYDISYPVLQGTAVFDKEYDIRSFPFYYVIDSKGVIVFSGSGSIEDEKEEALFKALRGVK